MVKRLSVSCAHRATNPRIFGSVARGEDTEKSDVDVLIDPLANTSLFDIGEMEADLESPLGIKVQVLTLGCLPASGREAVLKEAIPLAKFCEMQSLNRREN